MIFCLHCRKTQMVLKVRADMAIQYLEILLHKCLSYDLRCSASHVPSPMNNDDDIRC